MSPETLGIEDLSGTELHIDGIALAAMLSAASMGEMCEIRSSIDDAFGEKESSRKLEVVARRSHGYAHGRTVQTDFERFFGDHFIEPAALRTSVPLDDVCRLQRMVHNVRLR